MTGWSDAAEIVTAATAAAAATGGYVQFVLKRSLLPAAESDVMFTSHVRGPTELIGEVDLVVRNAGSTMLIVTGVRCRIAYRQEGDPEFPFALSPSEPTFTSALIPAPGEVYVDDELPPSQISSAGGPTATPSLPSSAVPSSAPVTMPLAWCTIVGPRTFIQPGVTQHYRKPIALPADTQVVHVWGAFDYQIKLGRLTSLLVGWLAPPPETLDWRKGVKNHTVRHTVSVPADLGRPATGGSPSSTG
jgi:hypothetical protein